MSSRSHPSQNCGEIVLQLSPDNSEWHEWEEIVLYEKHGTVFAVYSKEVGGKIGNTSCFVTAIRGGIAVFSQDIT
jgi:hypothetical protein